MPQHVRQPANISSTDLRTQREREKEIDGGEWEGCVFVVSGAEKVKKLYSAAAASAVVINLHSANLFIICPAISCDIR